MDEWTLYKRDIFSQLVKYFKEREAQMKPESCGILVYTEEEKTTTAQLRSNCSNFISQYRTWFINGTQNPNDDAVWEKYKKDLEGHGLATWQTLAQTVYDRQQAE